MAGEATVKRETELHIVCAVDGQPSIEVREPRQCQYSITLAVPELCSVKHFEPLEGDAAGDERTKANSGGSKHPPRTDIAEL